MSQPPTALNPRRQRRRDRPLAETIGESLRDHDGTPAELARRLGEPLSVVAFHSLRGGTARGHGGGDA